MPNDTGSGGRATLPAWPPTLGLPSHRPTSLPSFLPGAVSHARKGATYSQKYTKRGIAAFVVAIGAFAGVFYNDFRS